MDELTHLEQAVLRMFLAGSHPALAALRRQLAAARASSRRGTATSFSTRLDVGGVAPAAVAARRVVLSDVEAEIPGLAHRASFALFVTDGRLERLEGATRAGEEWPRDLAGFTLHHVEPDRDLADLG
ncbi:MAG TPA: hypothetical protein VMT17_13670 [Anaeromyxobacteraceae bacterium]|nr:hypothetical protein [Anaeromyxobacteraceae bacterium]